MHASFCILPPPSTRTSNARLERHTNDEAVCPPGRCDVQDVLPAIPCRESASFQRAGMTTSACLAHTWDGNGHPNSWPASIARGLLPVAPCLQKHCRLVSSFSCRPELRFSNDQPRSTPARVDVDPPMSAKATTRDASDEVQGVA